MERYCSRLQEAKTMRERDRTKRLNEYKRSKKGIRKERRREAVVLHRKRHPGDMNYRDLDNRTSSTATKPYPDITVAPGGSLWSKTVAALRSIFRWFTFRDEATR